MPGRKAWFDVGRPRPRGLRGVLLGYSAVCPAQASQLANLMVRFPPIRACIFDLDGLLINSEDVLTHCLNQILKDHERQAIPQDVRIKMMGVHNSTHGDTFHDWANLKISREQFDRELGDELNHYFTTCIPLPGAEKLLSRLSHAFNSCGDQLKLAIASSTRSETFQRKISNVETARLLGFIPASLRVLGDDPRLIIGQVKSAPDIFLTALEALRSDQDISDNDRSIQPDECLVFEDSLVGMEAARRAGMRVIWVPHPTLAAEMKPVNKMVLAGRLETVSQGDERQIGKIDDGWTEMILSLEHFNTGRYGIHIGSSVNPTKAE